MGAGGDPRNIENISLLQTVKRHIDHTLKLEKDITRSPITSLSPTGRRLLEMGRRKQ
jgi:hypothetical protein